MSGQIKLNPNQIADTVLDNMEIGPNSAYVTHHDVREAARRAAALALNCIAGLHSGDFWGMSTAEAAALLDMTGSGQDVIGRESEVVQ